MAATLNKTTDHRSILEKYTRKELQYIATAENREDIDPAMPANLMRRKFMETPPSRWPRPMSGTLGMHFDLKVPPFDTWLSVAYPDSAMLNKPVKEEVKQASADDDLEAQWNSHQNQRHQLSITEPTIETKSLYEDMPFYKLKSECKKLNIKFKRTDKKKDLLEKLTGHG